jgi:predicted tellurium resistance membrane protein TerC
MDFFSYDLIFTFLTLSFLEIILGIDNLIFISLVVSNLPQKYKNKARFFGLALALIIRLIMLSMLSWVMGLTKPLFTIFGFDFSFNNLLLIVGGIFLIFKSATEIYGDIKFHFASKKDVKTKIVAKATLMGAILQISAVDFIFSFDSIITAIGMTRNIAVIVAAVLVSMIVMLFASEYLCKFLEKYPSFKIVALGFIFMIGVILLADGLHMHITRSYLYFSLFFTLAIEGLNIAAQKK